MVMIVVQSYELSAQVSFEPHIVTCPRVVLVVNPDKRVPHLEKCAMWLLVFSSAMIMTFHHFWPTTVNSNNMYVKILSSSVRIKNQRTCWLRHNTQWYVFTYTTIRELQIRMSAAVFLTTFYRSLPWMHTDGWSGWSVVVESNIIVP